MYKNKFFKKSKRVLLIEPRGNFQAYFLPIGLGYLKSNTPSHHTVEIFDCSIDNISPDSEQFIDRIRIFKPDVIGISASIQTYYNALAVARKSKTILPTVTIVMGGAHPSIFPMGIFKNQCIDFVFQGEAELYFPHFLDVIGKPKQYKEIKGLAYRLNGTIHKNEIYLEKNIDKIIIPDYKACGLSKYLKRGYNYGGNYGRTAPIWLTRGCPYQCQYCSASLINGNQIRKHSLDYIKTWIDHLYFKFSIRQFAIIDDNFTFQIEYAKKFCKMIINLRQTEHYRENIFFATPNGIRLTQIDEELLTLMHDAGWKDITIAPESGSKKTLQAMRKYLNPDIVPDITRKIKKAGINVRAYFMIGYPGETIDDIKDTIRLIRKCKLDTFTMSRFYPIPGTPVFNELVNSGKLTADYIPPNLFKIMSPFGKKTEMQIYTPENLKNLNTFLLFFKEMILLVFRHPYSLIFFFKYYGFWNIIKKLFSFKKSS